MSELTKQEIKEIKDILDAAGIKQTIAQLDTKINKLNVEVMLDKGLYIHFKFHVTAGSIDENSAKAARLDATLNLARGVLDD